MFLFGPEDPEEFLIEEYWDDYAWADDWITEYDYPEDQCIYDYEDD